MKKEMVKKVFACGMSAAMVFAMAACGGSSETTAAAADTTAAAADTTAAADSTAAAADTTAAAETGLKDTYKVAVVKQMDHASLDEIADAIVAELDKLAEENGITIDYGQVYSGQGDQSILMQIGDQAISDGVDAIIPIATLAAQVMTSCAEETKTPVVFAAISDPEEADLVGIDYVTGTSDALNTDFILDMMLAQNPDVQKVGLL